jgi:hypothetical protein
MRDAGLWAVLMRRQEIRTSIKLLQSPRPEFAVLALKTQNSKRKTLNLKSFPELAVGRSSA